MYSKGAVCTDVFHGAKWIWTDNEDINQYIEIKADFSAVGSVAGARLYISADNEYAAYINGKLAGFGQYDDFPVHKSYDEMDVSEYIVNGANELFIRAYHQGVGSFQYLPGPAGVIFCLTAGDARLVSGKDALVRPCALYESGKIENISNQLSFTFHCDATKPEAPYAPAHVVSSRNDTALYPRPVRKLETGRAAASAERVRGVYALRGGKTPAERMQRAFLAPGCDREGANGEFYVFDLGREEAGLVCIDMICPEAGDILVGYGEHLDDMRVRTHVGGRNFAFSYAAKSGRNEFVHYFKRIAGRYLEAFVPFDTEIITLTILPVLYPTEERGAFSCADGVLNRMFEVSRRTLRLCMHEHYEDSPWREQGLYAMDSRNQALCGYLAFGEPDFPAASLALMAEGRRDDGLMEICAPAKAAITIPSFSLGFVVALRDFALYTGDMETAGRLFPAALDMLSFFEKRMENGLCATPVGENFWNFYEWAPGLDDGWEYGKGYENTDGTRRDAPLNLLFALGLCCAARTAEWLGKNAEAARLWALSEKVNAAANDAFWDAEAGAYRTYTNTKPHYCELVQSLALLSGAALGGRADVLRSRLADNDAKLVPATLSYALFKYEALIMDGRYRAAALSDAREKWGSMLFSGATSFWETIEGADAFGKAGSLCHGWSAVPVWLLVAAALGIQPVEPGFRTFTFNPMPELNINATIPTPFGDMTVRGGRIDYDKNTQKSVREF